MVLFVGSLSLQLVTFPAMVCMFSLLVLQAWMYMYIHIFIMGNKLTFCQWKWSASSCIMQIGIIKRIKKVKSMLKKLISHIYLKMLLILGYTLSALQRLFRLPEFCSLIWVFARHACSLEGNAVFRTQTISPWDQSCYCLTVWHCLPFIQYLKLSRDVDISKQYRLWPVL